MLRSINDLQDYAIRATDGDIGHVTDFYFDDEAWVIRYLVVDTGSWLLSRRVLISPIAIGQPDWAAEVLPVSITQDQVKNSPDIDTDRPVSRQHEISYLGYYGYPYYWGGAGLWGGGAYPGLMVPGGYMGLASTPHSAQSETGKAFDRAEEARHHDDDPHLRSCQALLTYHIEATDGGLGHVEGLLVDPETWAIRYLIVNTSNWWMGHKVLIAPEWIENVSWQDATVSINVTRQAVKDAPTYDPDAALDQEHEVGLYEHYGRPGYRATGKKREPALSSD
ncbi:MAG: PRC-barrel domain-containing protein [Pseudomonadota bacterium]|nr:PRC-barrel domain-containing protein [Pseudomonadota bacterium]